MGGDRGRQGRRGFSHEETGMTRPLSQNAIQTRFARGKSRKAHANGSILIEGSRHSGTNRPQPTPFAPSDPPSVTRSGTGLVSLPWGKR
jgi:hypothetical protein